MDQWTNECINVAGVMKNDWLKDPGGGTTSNDYDDFYMVGAARAALDV